MEKKTKSDKPENFKKPAIIRIARKAGIKNISEDCYQSIRNLILDKITDLLENAFIINEQTNTKTLMVNDVIGALKIQGTNLSYSTLSTDTCPKF